MSFCLPFRFKAYIEHKVNKYIFKCWGNAVSVLKIDYVEFGTGRIAESREFFARAFGWEFTEYGPQYVAFNNAGIDGGLDGTEGATKMPLVVLKSDNLEGAQKQIEAAGGKIVKEIFSFPGGRRFHFVEPGGNELAVWSAD